jgi:hypothetical protein
MRLVEEIRNSDITEVLFTSGFGKNNACRLFYCDILKQKITKEIRAQRGLTLLSEHFGRPVKLTVLYSPSGSSNVGISKSKLYQAKKHNYIHLDKPVKQFRIDYYKEKFCN